jgi:hypothetical protein
MRGSRGRNVPEPVAAFLAKVLAKKPHERRASVAEVAAALQHATDATQGTRRGRRARSWEVALGVIVVLAIMVASAVRKGIDPRGTGAVSLVSAAEQPHSESPAPEI